MGFWSAKSRSTSFPSSDSTEKTVDSEACNASSLPQVLPSEFSTSSSRHTTTTAVNRSINDVHTPTWVGLIVLNSSLRATLFHPLQLALARKRVVQESPSPSVFHLISAAYRGGVRVLPGTKSSIDFGPGGMRSLYRGYGAALISSLIGESLYLVILESFKERVVTHISSSSNSSWTDAEGREDRDSSNANIEEALYLGHHWASASAAMIADLLTLFAVTPIAVVVGRQMTSGVGLAADNQYRTVFGTFRHLWHLHQPPAEKKWTALSSSSSCSVRSSLFRQDHSPLMTSTVGQGTATPFYSTRKDIEMPNRIVDKSVVKRNAVRCFVDRHSSQVTRPFWQTVYGIRGLYQGTSAALLRIPSSGLWWGVYTVSKEKLYSLCGPTLQSWKNNGSSSSSLEWNQNWFLSPSDNPCLNASASAIASAVTTVAVNPIAVVQIRLQSVTKATTATTSSTNVIASKQRSWLSRRKVPTAKHSFSGIAKDILRKEGIRGFFKGVTTNTCISVLDGIVFATMYELTKLGSDYNFLSAN